MTASLCRLLVLAGLEAPLVEVPRPFERQRLGVDATPLGDDLAEPPGVVGHDPVEVDPEHELSCHRRQPREFPLAGTADDPAESKFYVVPLPSPRAPSPRRPS